MTRHSFAYSTPRFHSHIKHVFREWKIGVTEKETTMLPFVIALACKSHLHNARTTTCPGRYYKLHDLAYLFVLIYSLINGHVNARLGKLH